MKKMIKILLFILIIGQLFVVVGKTISRLFRPKMKSKATTSESDNWYGICEKCGRKVGKDRISKMDFAMCVRTTMLSYMKELSKKMSFKNGLLVYSFWSGYKYGKNMKDFLSECEEMGLKIETLHTSGHADEKAVKKLIETVNPDVIIPVHTENAERFKEIAPDIYLYY